MEIIGQALAGHAFRIQGGYSPKKYDNPLTDFVNLMIAQVGADMNREDDNKQPIQMDLFNAKESL
jgi:hypothetical protein